MAVERANFLSLTLPKYVFIEMKYLPMEIRLARAIATIVLSALFHNTVTAYALLGTPMTFVATVLIGIVLFNVFFYPTEHRIEIGHNPPAYDDKVSAPGGPPAE